jgi:SAM-dependent methyltransferase
MIMYEQTKASKRRLSNPFFIDECFIGNGIDIGAGPDPISKTLFPNIQSVKDWDLKDGDAQYMKTVEDGTFDFVNSSHCLEHMVNPYTALYNWIRICKSGGYIIITIPDETLYEQGFWPSRFNNDHKWSFTLGTSGLPKSVNVPEMLSIFNQVEMIHTKLILDGFDFSKPRGIDQTHGAAECAIEFVLKKK